MGRHIELLDRSVDGDVLWRKIDGVVVSENFTNGSMFLKKHSKLHMARIGHLSSLSLVSTVSNGQARFTFP